jgi:hypothetical protein
MHLTFCNLIGNDVLADITLQGTDKDSPSDLGRGFQRNGMNEKYMETNETSFSPFLPVDLSF